MQEILLDANVIVRFLTNDDEIQSPRAYELFERAVNGEFVFVLSPLIVAECTWVLSNKRYGYTKAEIAEKFNVIISSPGIKTIEKDMTLKALSGYSLHNVDFIDAYLGVMAQFTDINHVVTWNVKDFKRLGVEFYTPEHLLNID